MRGTLAAAVCVAATIATAISALAEVPYPPARPDKKDALAIEPSARDRVARDVFAVEPPPPDGPIIPLPPVRKVMPRINLPLDAGSRTAARGGEQVVCKDPRIVGRRKPVVAGHIAGCGIGAPVEVIRISGIRLSRPATMDCPTARTFANWLTGVVDKLAQTEMKSRVARVWIMGSYTCRTRNNRRGARLSEHAKGRAVDVGGFTLKDGRRVQVLKHWGKGAPGRILRRAWKLACGSFTTVLGPNADRHHQDHLHLDTANRRNSYCR